MSVSTAFPARSLASLFTSLTKCKVMHVFVISVHERVHLVQAESSHFSTKLPESECFFFLI